MKITVNKEITIASYRRRLHSSKMGKVFACAEGKATFAVEADESEKDNVELTISKGAELKVHDLLFGTHGAVSISNGKLEFKFGLDDFEVTFNPHITNPISFHIPPIKIPVAGKAFRLEKEIPSLGLKGTAEIKVGFVIEYHPDYRRLAKAMSPKNLRATLQVAKNKLIRFSGKAKSISKVVVKAGRAAIYAPFRVVGRFLVNQFVKKAVELGSQAAALRKVLGIAGRLIGVAGIVIDTWLLVKEAIPGILSSEHRKVIDLLNPRFAEGYGRLLALYTDKMARNYDALFEQMSKVERLGSEPPDLYGVIETLSKTEKVVSPNKSVADWRDAQVANGLKYRTDTTLVSDAHWQAMYREAYNVCMVFLNMATHSKHTQRSRVANEAVTKAVKLVEAAGQIAACQDILAFAASTSLYEDQKGNQPNDVWEDWKDVAEFHRAMFGDDMVKRMLHYTSLIDLGSLRVTIPPFGDYADWA